MFGKKADVVPHKVNGVKVGLHHIHSKESFNGDANYDPDSAPCISRQQMVQDRLNHGKMTAYQQREYIHAGKSGASHQDRQLHDDIALGALKAGGMSCGAAQDAVERSRAYLDQQGCHETKLPWWRNK